jgi:hypothetical protein
MVAFNVYPFLTGPAAICSFRKSSLLLNDFVLCETRIFRGTSRWKQTAVHRWGLIILVCLTQTDVSGPEQQGRVAIALDPETDPL